MVFLLGWTWWTPSGIAKRGKKENPQLTRPGLTNSLRTWNHGPVENSWFMIYPLKILMFRKLFVDQAGYAWIFPAIRLHVVRGFSSHENWFALSSSLPSGKHTINNGQSPLVRGFSHEKQWFSIVFWMSTRGYLSWLLVILILSSSWWITCSFQLVNYECNSAR